MKTLVIGDIHNRVDWIEPFLQSVEHDNVIFLGDYFDDFGDTPDDATKTAEWLAKSVLTDNRIHLIGNHDQPYKYVGNLFFDNFHGFTNNKSKAINKVFNKYNTNIWSKIKYAHFDFKYNYIYSHAGLTAKLFPFCPVKGPDLKKYSDIISNGEQTLVDNDQACVPIFTNNIDGSYSGITWIRPESMEIIPTVSQVVGHTPCHTIYNCPIEKSRPFYVEDDMGGSVTYLDCKINWVGLVDNGIMHYVSRDNGVIIPRYSFDYS